MTSGTPPIPCVFPTLRIKGQPSNRLPFAQIPAKAPLPQDTVQAPYFHPQSCRELATCLSHPPPLPHFSPELPLPEFTGSAWSQHTGRSLPTQKPLRPASLQAGLLLHMPPCIISSSRRTFSSTLCCSPHRTPSLGSSIRSQVLGSLGLGTVCQYYLLCRRWTDTQPGGAGVLEKRAPQVDCVTCQPHHGPQASKLWAHRLHPRSAEMRSSQLRLWAGLALLQTWFPSRQGRPRYSSCHSLSFFV